MAAEFSWKGIRKPRMLFIISTKEEGYHKEKQKGKSGDNNIILEYKNKMQRNKWIHGACYVTKCTAKRSEKCFVFLFNLLTALQPLLLPLKSCII